MFKLVERGVNNENEAHSGDILSALPIPQLITDLHVPFLVRNRQLSSYKLRHQIIEIRMGRGLNEGGALYYCTKYTIFQYSGFQGR